MGTPEAMYDSFEGEYKTDCPLRYQGQYEDAETGLYYNRFRYYDPDNGGYLSQDPIGLTGNNPIPYGYVKDTNGWLDPYYGLDVITSNGIKITGFTVHGVDRAIGRGVPPTSILDAVKNPLKVGDVKFDSMGRPSL